MKKSNHKWEIGFTYFKEKNGIRECYTTFGTMTGSSKKELLREFSIKNLQNNRKFTLISITKIY